MSAEAAPADKLIGEILADRYQILHRLGEGAMGVVYKARHVKVGRAFAVKVLHARLLKDAKDSLRFDREAELAGRLRHANVVGVVDVGEVNGARYMVMDFAEGPDLAELLVEAPMPAERIIHLVRQLLEGLYHAHEQGLIHRDFKPENVIVERDAHGAEMPRIVDFGIAILREAGAAYEGQGRLTTNGLVLGTPHYMAPEQAVADPIDHRIDLFALGIVVYEMLSGRLPFDGNGAEVARANLLLDPPPIAKRVPYLEVDSLLEAFARRLMEKKREARPATAKAARELLDLIESDRVAAATALGVPVTDRTPGATVRVPPQQHGALSDLGSAVTVQMKPTPQASSPPLPAKAPAGPPVVFSAPQAPQAPQSGRAMATQTPFSWEADAIAKRRTPWLITGIAVGAVGIAAAVLIASTGSTQDGAPIVMKQIAPGTRTAAAAPAPTAEPKVTDGAAPGSKATTPVATDPTVSEPRPSEPKPSDPKPSDPKPSDPKPSDSKTKATGPTATERDSVADAKPATKRTPVRNVKPSAASPDARPHETRTTTTTDDDRKIEDARRPATAEPPGAADTKVTDPRPKASKVPAPRTARTAALESKPTTGVTPKALSMLYYHVAAQLKPLPEARALPLWDRWKRLNVQALMLAPQPERDAAAVELNKILDEAAR